MPLARSESESSDHVVVMVGSDEMMAAAVVMVEKVAANVDLDHAAIVGMIVDLLILVVVAIVVLHVVMKAVVAGLLHRVRVVVAVVVIVDMTVVSSEIRAARPDSDEDRNKADMVVVEEAVVVADMLSNLVQHDHRDHLNQQNRFLKKRLQAQYLFAHLGS